jgi:hypothetical protein
MAFDKSEHVCAMKGDAMKGEKGNVSVEFGFLLPMFVGAVISFACLAIMCIKGFVLSVAAFEASRDYGNFQDNPPLALYASLAPGFLRNLRVDRISSNVPSKPGVTDVGVATARSSSGTPAGTFMISRSAPIAPAVSLESVDEMLNGGDTPSPYCLDGRNIRLCGYR